MVQAIDIYDCLHESLSEFRLGMLFIECHGKFGALQGFFFLFLHADGQSVCLGFLRLLLQFRRAQLLLVCASCILAVLKLRQVSL